MGSKAAATIFTFCGREELVMTGHQFHTNSAPIQYQKWQGKVSKSTNRPTEVDQDILITFLYYKHWSLCYTWASQFVVTSFILLHSCFVICSQVWLFHGRLKLKRLHSFTHWPMLCMCLSMLCLLIVTVTIHSRAKSIQLTFSHLGSLLLPHAPIELLTQPRSGLIMPN